MSVWWSAALVVVVSALDKVATCSGLGEHGRQMEAYTKNPMTSKIDMVRRHLQRLVCRLETWCACTSIISVCCGELI
jgi:hypothetical protein